MLESRVGTSSKRQHTKSFAGNALSLDWKQKWKETKCRKTALLIAPSTKLESRVGTSSKRQHTKYSTGYALRLDWKQK